MSRPPSRGSSRIAAAFSAWYLCQHSHAADGRIWNHTWHLLTVEATAMAAARSWCFHNKRRKYTQTSVCVCGVVWCTTSCEIAAR